MADGSHMFMKGGGVHEHMFMKGGGVHEHMFMKGGRVHEHMFMKGGVVRRTPRQGPGWPPPEDGVHPTYVHERGGGSWIYVHEGGKGRCS